MSARGGGVCGGGAQAHLVRERLDVGILPPALVGEIIFRRCLLILLVSFDLARGARAHLGHLPNRDDQLRDRMEEAEVAIEKLLVCPRGDLALEGVGLKQFEQAHMLTTHQLRRLGPLWGGGGVGGEREGWAGGGWGGRRGGKTNSP